MTTTTTTTMITTTTEDGQRHEEVKTSKWVKVEIVGKKVRFTTKAGHGELILRFHEPSLFVVPCEMLHLTKPEIVELDAHRGRSLYDVYEPDKKERHVVPLEKNTRGNCKSYVVEASNPSGPIIVT